MTAKELGITPAGQDYIEAIINHGLGFGTEAEVERTRAIVRVEGGVGDERDHELAAR